MRSEGYSTLFVCLSVTTLQASIVDRPLKFRLQRIADDTLKCFDSWILITMLASRDMANFVSQEAYERARDLSARDHVSCKSHALAVRHQTRALFSEQSELYVKLVRFCVSKRFPVGCLICLRDQACLYARLVLVVVVWFILER